MDTDDLLAAPPDPEAPPVVREKVPPIESRFLFVDIAALRAKQLRRGATPRLDQDGPVEPHRLPPHKPERIAMEEIRQGLVPYELPS